VINLRKFRLYSSRALGGDVGRRIAESHEPADAGPRGFGHDLAGSVLREPIDHHTIIAEQRANLSGALFIESWEIRRLVQPRHHRSDCAASVAVFAGRGFGFNHDLSG